MILSKEAHELLQENGYYCSINNEVVKFTHSKISAYVLIIILVILLPILLAFVFDSMLSGSIIMLIIMTLIVVFIIRVFTKTPILLNSNSDILSTGSIQIPFKSISDVNLTSEFVSEYSSAFKETTQEYNITIHIIQNNGQDTKLMNLKSDYQDPNNLIKEVETFIRSRIIKSI